MSDHERFPQVAHQKWANECIAHFFSESLICSFLAKTSNSLKKTDERIPSPVIQWIWYSEDHYYGNDFEGENDKKDSYYDREDHDYGNDF